MRFAIVLALLAGCDLAEEPSTGKDLVAFSLQVRDNPALTGDVIGTIADIQIAVTVPFGTDVHALIATFSTTGASVFVAGMPQTSRATPNDFTDPITYTVRAEDRTTKDYRVTLTVAQSSARDLTSFGFLRADNLALPADISTTIDDTTISAIVPFGTDRSGLVPTFTTTGTRVMVGAEPQDSGVTHGDFRTERLYTVIAADRSTKVYRVVVTEGPRPTKDLTSFGFAAAYNPRLSRDISATIVGKSVSAVVPLYTEIDDLVPSFSTTGTNVTVGGAIQTSDLSHQDFRAPVTYTVHAFDGSSQGYDVIVTRPAARDATFATDRAPSAIALADFDGDGRLDVAVIATLADAVSVYRNTTSSGAAAPSLAAKVDLRTGSYPISIAAADFNGDGKPDLAVANQSSGTISMFLNTSASGSVSFAAMPDLQISSPMFVAAGDFNYDGNPDLVVTTGSNLAMVYLNAGPSVSGSITFQSPVGFAVDVSPTFVAVADLNQDAMPDLVVVGNNSHAVSILINMSQLYATTPSFTAKTDFATGGLPGSIGVADFDGDGLLDLAVAEENGNSVGVLLNATLPGDITPSFLSDTSFAVSAAQPRCLTVADLDGDGRPDIVAADLGADRLSVLSNTGTTTVARFALGSLSTGRTPTFITSGDLDGDGKPDLVHTNEDDDTITIRLTP